MPVPVLPAILGVLMAFVIPRTDWLAFADERETPTSSTTSLQVTAVADSSELEVGDDLNVYITLRNTGRLSLTGLQIEIIAPPGMSKPRMAVDWPHALAPNNSATQRFTFKAIKDGKFNLGVIVYSEEEAGGGAVFSPPSLSSIVVKKMPLLPIDLPESILAALVGLLAGLVGTIIGFVLSLSKDFFRDRQARKETLIASYGKMVGWLQQLSSTLSDQNTCIRSCG